MTVDLAPAPANIPSSSPVFVDDSGGKRRRTRRLSKIGGTLVLAYFLVVAASFSRAPWVPRLSLPGVGNLLPPTGPPAIPRLGSALVDAARPLPPAVQPVDVTWPPVQPSSDPSTPVPAAANTQDAPSQDVVELRASPQASAPAPPAADVRSPSAPGQGLGSPSSPGNDSSASLPNSPASTDPRAGTAPPASVPASPPQPAEAGRAGVTGPSPAASPAAISAPGVVGGAPAGAPSASSGEHGYPPAAGAMALASPGAAPSS